MRTRVPKIFDQVAQKMRADFKQARSALKHSGLKGASFEDTFHTFLRQYLVPSLSISSGVIIDAHGGISRQIDTLITDAAKTPILFRSREIRVVPVECVYAVIEVKAYLDSAELNRVFENMLSVRALKKTAYVPRSGVIIEREYMYGKEWDIWPINYFVFAYESIPLDTIADLISKKHQELSLPEYSRIDSVCVLDKGVICNRSSDGMFDALPEPSSKIFVCTTTKALLLFYTLISRYFNQARLPNFRFTDYLGEITF